MRLDAAFASFDKRLSMGSYLRSLLCVGFAVTAIARADTTNEVSVFVDRKLEEAVRQQVFGLAEGGRGADRERGRRSQPGASALDPSGPSWVGRGTRAASQDLQRRGEPDDGASP